MVSGKFADAPEQHQQYGRSQLMVFPAFAELSVKKMGNGTAEAAAGAVAEPRQFRHAEAGKPGMRVQQGQQQQSQNPCGQFDVDAGNHLTESKIIRAAIQLK